jgi:hypothetical protein
MDNPSNPHHLVLGQLTDILTGAVLTDTYDERYRQKIAGKLIFDKGFEPADIQNNIPVEVCAGRSKAMVKIDFMIEVQGKIIALIKFAPGSLVTRRLSTLALSRIVTPYQIPVVVITNGEDAEIIDGGTGKLVSTGLENLPDKEKITKDMGSWSFPLIQKKVFDQASRIAFACEIDGACPCDTDVCIIE